MNDRLSLLLPFVPQHVKQQSSQTLSWPRVTHCDAVIAIVDISGYTKATRDLVEKADYSPQQVGLGLGVDARNASQYVGNMVKHFLDPLFQRIVGSGGDIVKFGGDSVIALWIIRENSDAAHIYDAASTAVQCCIDAACYVRQNPLLDLRNELMNVAVHAVVHFGKVSLLQLGDPHLHRAESVCYGQDFNLACSLLNQSLRDQVLVTNTTMSRLNGFRFQPKRVSAKREESTQFTTYNIDTGQTLEGMPTKVPDQSSDKYLSESMVAETLLYADASLQPRLPVTQKYKDLQEIRQVTISFIHLKYKATDGDVVPFENTTFFAFQLQELLINTLQEVDEQKSGLLRQLSIDDKGITLLLLFGLPPYTTENACITAATVTRRLLRVYRKSAFSASAGIASGRVFTGVIGCETRMEHAVLGNAINLAARLMMSDEAQDDILCDSSTAAKLPSTLMETFSLPEPLQLKGWSEPVPAFTVCDVEESPNQEQVLEYVLSPTQNTNVTFHDQQDDQVWRVPMDKWLETKCNTTFVIEGTSGSGKTCTALRMIEHLKEKNIPVWQFSSFEIESSVPFHTLRNIGALLQNLFQTHPVFSALQEQEQKEFEMNSADSSMTDPRSETSSVTSHTSIIERHRRLLGFLSRHFQLDDSFILRAFIDLRSISARSTDGTLTGQTTHLNVTPEDLLQRIEYSCVSLLNCITSMCPLVIVCDDCQWQDRYSWILTHSLVSQCPNILIIAISRPGQEYSDPSLREIYKVVCARSIHIPIGVISERRLTAILSQALAKSETNVRRLALAMHQMSGGNAFAVDVLLKHLQRNNADVDALLQADPASILPQDMNDVFITQLDRLDSRFQSIVRMAALIGQVFRLNHVLDLCRLKDITTSMIQQWDKYGFLEQLPDVEGQRWRFRHCLIAYQISFLMTSTERRAMHEQIGEFYNGLLQQHKSKSTNLHEILPIVHQQFLSSGNEIMTFKASCKLMNMYYKLEMYFEARRHFLHWVENSPFLEQELDEMKRLKVLSIGLESAAMCEDGTTVRRLFKPYLSFCGIKFPNYKLKKLFYVLQLIKDHRNFWNKGVLPRIQLPEPGIEKRLSYLRMVMMKCSAVLEYGEGKKPGLEYYIAMMSIYDLHIAYRHLLPDPLITEITMLSSASLFFTNLKGARTCVDFLGIEHEQLEKNRILQALEQCKNLSRSELEKLTDFGRFGQYFGFRVYLTNYNLVRALDETRTICKTLIRLNWLSGWISTMSGCGAIWVMSGSYELPMEYVRRLRKYMDDNPGVAVHSQDSPTGLSGIAGILGEHWSVKQQDPDFVKDFDFCWQVLSKHVQTKSMFTLEMVSASGRFRLALCKGDISGCLAAVEAMQRCLRRIDSMPALISTCNFISFSFVHLVFICALPKYAVIKSRIISILRKSRLKISKDKNDFHSSMMNQSKVLSKIIILLNDRPQEALKLVQSQLPLVRGVENKYFEAGLLTVQFFITKETSYKESAASIFKEISYYWSVQELQSINL